MRPWPLAFAFAACSASAPTQRPVKAPVVAQAAPRADLCPLALDGALLEVKDVEQGVALEFTSYADVSELRRRVRLLADIRHADARRRFVEDVEGGARIVFPAEYKVQVAALAKRMDTGSCPTSLPTVPDEQVVVFR